MRRSQGGGEGGSVSGFREKFRGLRRDASMTMTNVILSGGSPPRKVIVTFPSPFLGLGTGLLFGLGLRV